MESRGSNGAGDEITTTDVLERSLERRRHRLGAGRRSHAARRADEQRIAEELAEARERVAHRGLRESDTRRRSRDVSLGQERAQRDEQVEVEPFEMHRVHG